MKMKRQEGFNLQNNNDKHDDSKNRNDMNTYVKWDKTAEDDFILNLNSDKIFYLSEKLKTYSESYSTVTNENVNDSSNEVKIF